MASPGVTRVACKVPCPVESCETLFDVEVDLVPYTVHLDRPSSVAFRTDVVDRDGFRERVGAHAAAHGIRVTSGGW